MNYEFTNLTPRGEPFEAPKGIEAITYNGHLLDEEISGFLTLSVEGREDFKREINSVDISGDGSQYLSSRLDDRELVVNFYFESENIDEYNQSLQILKNILREPNGVVSFADDPHHHYVGTPELSITGGTLAPTGKITIALCNPFKMSEKKVVSATDSNQITISDPELVFPQLPFTVKLTAKEDASNLIIENNSGQRFSTVTGISSGDKIDINFEDLTYIVNEQDQTGNVALSANFGDFNIKNDTQITINILCNIKLVYEAKNL